MGASQRASSLDEAHRGSHVRHHQQRLGPGLLCKDVFDFHYFGSLYLVGVLTTSRSIVGFEGNLSAEIGLHSCDKGWLGVDPSSQGLAPRVARKAP